MFKVIVFNASPQSSWSFKNRKEQREAPKGQAHFFPLMIVIQAPSQNDFYTILLVRRNFCFLTIKMVQEKIFKEVNCLWTPWDSIRHLFAAMLSPPHTKKQELRILLLRTPGLEHLYYLAVPSPWLLYLKHPHS